MYQTIFHRLNWLCLFVMEKHVQRKIETHQVAFKSAIKTWFTENKVKALQTASNMDLTSDLLKFVYDYGGLQLTKEDFQKRKRIKNVVPHFMLCTAKRANGNQCTRRKKDEESPFCGTHMKGQPHGVVDVNVAAQPQQTKVEVWVQEIKGINYYIDANNNVYRPEDIIANKQNPNVIAKWALNQAGAYCIPAFGI
jgi:hypothetical protein